jgi:CubicO group peptidase (beta-lactamase class C family)
MTRLLLLLAAATTAAGAPPDFTAALAILTDAIAARVFPGAAAGVLDADGSVLLSAGLGSQVYAGEAAPLGGNAATDAASLWDMASITKIVGATTATALLVQRGLLALDTRVADDALLGPRFDQGGKGAITVRDLLLHRAGFPPDPVPGYDDPVFGCPATRVQPTPPLNFSCVELVLTAVLAQPLAYAPRSAWVYSDLSMITLAYALGGLVEAQALVPRGALRPDCAGAAPPGGGLARLCFFEAFVRLEVLDAAGMANASFLPARARWASAMPTYADPTYRHEIMQGAVSDENAYAQGGVSGHAGLFASLTDMLAFVRTWAVRAPPLLSAATRALFLTAPDPAASPRALGWATQGALDDNRDCGSWPNSTAYHTGFTGTLICVDVHAGVSLVLLTTRVYPNKTANDDAVWRVRQNFSTAVAAALLGRA